jgi:hypothetical protein
MRVSVGLGLRNLKMKSRWVRLMSFDVIWSMEVDVLL